MASRSVFSMWPEAQTRPASPRAMSVAPTASEATVGRATASTTTATTQPRGTRSLDGNARGRAQPQPPVDRLEDLARGNGVHHTFVDPARAAMAGCAQRHPAHHHVPWREGPIARGVGGAEEAHHRRLDRGGQV